MEQTAKYIDSLLTFIKNSPTAFHTIKTISTRLTGEGYTPLMEQEAWNLVPGGKYFVTRNESSVVAFQIPETPYKGFQIVASHSDSPTFKLKEHAEMAAGKHYTVLNTEKYGGMLYAPWMDRPLSLAGRVMVREENGIASRLIKFDRDLVMIPNLAIHMNRAANDGVAMNPQVDLLPLFGDERAKDTLNSLIAQECGVKEEDVLGTDLFLYQRMAPSVWGYNNEYFSSPQLDDLECAYSSMEGFLASTPIGSVKVCAVFDNEEVGSGTKQGAASTFLYDTLRRINSALGCNEEEYYRAVANSFMLSADNAHAQHPAHREKTDDTNAVFMNEGVVIKHNANQKYTTDAVSGAMFTALCQKAGVPVQHFSNRSDVPGGSTLGNISNTQVSLNTVDIGLAQLAMHSCYETAGVKDVEYMVNAIKEFYSHTITTLRDGSYRIDD